MIDHAKAATALVQHISGARTLNPAERKILAAVLEADWQSMKAELEKQMPQLKAALDTRMKSFKTEKALSKRGARNLRTLAL